MWFFVPVLSGQRIFTLTDESVTKGPVEPFKGCARLSPDDSSSIFTFDMSLGSADVTGSTWASNATHHCGSVQCPTCFLVEDSKIENPVTLYIQTCHALMRSVTSGKVKSNSLCGYKTSIEDVLGTCETCTSRSEGAECARCVDERVRCFEDCDPLLISGECDSADPHEFCQYCGNQKPRSDTLLPREGGGQFSYFTGDRVIEYLFINNSTEPLTVGTGPTAVYPTDLTTLDTNVLVAGAARSALCYRGRFYWQ